MSINNPSSSIITRGDPEANKEKKITYRGHESSLYTDRTESENISLIHRRINPTLRFPGRANTVPRIPWRRSLPSAENSPRLVLYQQVSNPRDYRSEDIRADSSRARRRDFLRFHGSVHPLSIIANLTSNN